jgi:DamX protein
MAEVGRGFLGLTHNPFAQPGEGFFEAADRKLQLGQLLHLSQWSSCVLLVLGPGGAGKTTLCREYAASAEPRCELARIRGSLVNISREVLASLASAFAIDVPADANIQWLSEHIGDHVERRKSVDQVCVVLVDDADLLEARAIIELLRLSGSCGLRLVLFGEARLVPAIARVVERLELETHEIRLSAFNERQTQQYIEWRFQQARYRGRMPFTSRQVKVLHRLSGGFPGRINQMANVLLVKLESGETDTATSGFPIVHRALLFLLVVVVGLVLVLWRGDEPVVDAQVSVATQTPAEPDLAYRAAAAEAAPAEVVPEGSISGKEAPEEKLAAPRRPPAITPVLTSPVETKSTAAADPENGARPAAAGEDERKGAQWLLSQAPDQFTVQLITLSTAAGARIFVAAMADPASLATYRLLRNERVLYVVVSGVFASRAEAESASARLSVDKGDLRPWVRRLGAIQGDIRTANLSGKTGAGSLIEEDRSG